MQDLKVGSKIDGSCQSLLKIFNKLSYPARTVIVLAVGDEDVVFVTANYGRHKSFRSHSDVACLPTCLPKL